MTHLQMMKRVMTAALIAVLSLGLLAPAARAETNTPAFVQITVGDMVTGAVRPDGSLWMWGASGFFGLGTRNHDMTFSKQAGGSSDWKQVAFGSELFTGIKKDGTLWGWGFNDIGQVGVGSANNPRYVTQPQEIGGGRRFKSVSTYWAHSVAIGEDGSLWGWGSNFYGEAGTGGGHQSAPEQIGDDTDWVEAIAGFAFTIALKADGSMWAWGSAANGALGDGRMTDSLDGLRQYTPKRIGNFGFTSVSLGNVHAVALAANGTLWTWGFNGFGQLGDGTKVTRPIPTQIGTDRWNAAVATTHTTIGIKSDGSLWMWGDRQPGDSDRTLPLQVGTDQDWAFIASSGAEYGEHIILGKRDGSLWGFGVNDYGQLGTDTEGRTETPVKMLISRTLAEVLGTTDKPSLEQVHNAVEPLKEYMSVHFNDVDRAAWYAPALAKLVGLRVMSGSTDGTLNPTGTVAVDQFLKMLLAARGVELPNGAQHWASTWIDQAMADGFITKGQFDRFDRPITRAEMAQVIAAVIRTESSATVPTDLEDRITDFSAISAADQAAVLDVYARGILTGRPDGTFQPASTLTRAEAGIIILRVIDPGARVLVQ